MSSVLLDEIKQALDQRDFDRLSALHARANEFGIENCDKYMQSTAVLQMHCCYLFKDDPGHMRVMYAMLQAVGRNRHPYDDDEAKAAIAAAQSGEVFTRKRDGMQLPTPTKPQPGTPDRPIRLEIEDLPALGLATITDLGEENLYAEKDGLHYYCKVFDTERYALGLWDFMKLQQAATPKDALLTRWQDNGVAWRYLLMLEAGAIPGGYDEDVPPPIRIDILQRMSALAESGWEPDWFEAKAYFESNDTMAVHGEMRAEVARKLQQGQDRAPYTVMSVDASSGQIYCDHVYATSGLGAFPAATELREGVEFVAAVRGHITEDDDLTFPGESVVDDATVREQLEVFGTAEEVSVLAEQEGVLDPVGAKLFFDELLDSVETLGGIAEEHGVRTLANLMYLQQAILTGTFIDSCPDEDGVLAVLASLPSGERWKSFVKTSEPDASL